MKQISNTINGSILQKNQSQGKKKRTSWSREEDCRLIKAHFGYGKDWVAIASYVKNRTNIQCQGRAKKLLPKHYYICTPNTTWFYTAKDYSVYGPYSNGTMCELVRRGRLTGDAEISRNSSGPFGPM